MSDSQPNQVEPGLLFSLKVLFYKSLMAGLKVLVKLIPARKPLVFTGPGSAQDLCEAIATFDLQRVLIVTDATLVKLGMIEPMKAALEKRGIAVAIYDGVLPDPTHTVIEEGLAALKQHNADSILAVGGGSPMDAAKVIGACATNNASVAKLSGVLKVKKPILPLFAIPTTAGTGSETTIAAVVSDPKSHQKSPVVDPKLVPVATALDPELMTGLPPAITAATGMDAMTHAIESYLSKHAASDTDAYALAAIRMIFGNLRTAYSDGMNLEARQAMAVASFYAGVAFTKANVGYVHAIAHQFGAFYHVPHGLANAIVLPHILKYSKPAATDRMSDLAIAAGLGGKDEDAAELAQKFVDAISALNEELGIPQKLDKLKQDDIPQIAKGALKEAHYLYPVPRYMDQATCEGIVAAMLP